MLDLSTETFAPAPWAPTPSAKWLSFGDSTDRFLLLEDVSVSMLELQIKAAMRSGDPLSIEVQAQVEETTRHVILNPRVLPYVVVTEEQ
jgi:hypothetical protein